MHTDSQKLELKVGALSRGAERWPAAEIWKGKIKQSQGPHLLRLGGLHGGQPREGGQAATTSKLEVWWQKALDQ